MFKIKKESLELARKWNDYVKSTGKPYLTWPAFDEGKKLVEREGYLFTDKKGEDNDN